MAWLQKRPKLRRISADRSKPLPKRTAHPLTPPGKRAGCYLITVLFMLGAVVVLNFPAGDPPVRSGDLARRDYRARATFSVLDTAATGRAREAAAALARRVFHENTEHLDRLPLDAERFFRNMADSRKPHDLFPAAKAKWGLSEAQFAVLQEDLDRKWILTIADAVDATLKRAAKCGIMTADDRQAEMNSERDEIVVRSDVSGRQEIDRSKWQTLEYPTEVREHFVNDKDLKDLLARKSEKFRNAFFDMLTHAAKPTLRLDKEATENATRAARGEARERFRTISKDSVILPAGERATPETVTEIEAERQAWSHAEAGARDPAESARALQRKGLAAMGATAIFLGGFVLLVLAAPFVAPEVLVSNTRIGGVYGAILVSLAATRLLEAFGGSLQWSPVVLAAMVLTVTAGPALSLGATAFIVVLDGLVAPGGLVTVLPLMLGGAVAIFEVHRLRRRTQSFEAGVVAGAVQMLCVWALWACQFATLPDSAPTPDWPVEDSIAALAGGVLAGALLTAALPYLERLFDVATELRLLEWTDQNQPLLRKLALEAPGTYHHSTVVSNMAEVAAEEIGANALLACAGGYLHDVGKISRPEYFVENRNGQPSRHDALSPMLSTMILTAHTKDGVELAAHYGVPTPIRRIISEHHGTTVTEFFFQKAVRAAGASGAAVKDSSFRYRGPKPHSPESAIVMLADAAESAARSLEHASSSRLEKLVHTIVQARLEDGQLDFARLDITDVRTVERSLARSLIAIAHPRIRYSPSADV